MFLNNKRKKVKNSLLEIVNFSASMFDIFTVTLGSVLCAGIE